MYPRADRPHQPEAMNKMGNPTTFWKGYDDAESESICQSPLAASREWLIPRLLGKRAAYCRGYLNFYYDREELLRDVYQWIMQELDSGTWWHLDVVESRSRRHRVPSCEARDVPFWWA